MAFPKRLSDILTPPSWLWSSKPDRTGTGSSPDHVNTGPSLSHVGDILKKLLGAESPSSPSSDSAAQLSQLKEIAKKYGCQHLAHEIRDTVGRLPETSSSGEAYKKGRGFELAADLFIQHARGLMRDLPSGAALREVKATVAEIVSCYFLAGKHLKGVEASLDFSSVILCQCVAAPSMAEDYMRTAHEIGGSTLDLTLQADESLRHSNRSSDSDPGDLQGTARGIPTELLSYLGDSQEQVRNLRDKLADIVRGSVVEDAGPVSPDRWAYLTAVAHEAEAAGHTSLAAAAWEAMAALPGQAGRPAGADCVNFAVALYEKSARTAQECGLLSTSRQIRARVDGIRKRSH